MINVSLFIMGNIKLGQMSNITIQKYNEDSTIQHPFIVSFARAHYAIFVSEIY